MPLPKQKHTKSRRNRRRSHLALKAQVFGICQKCGQSVLPHRVCPNCGVYQGKEVIDVLKKLTKRERKQKEKEIKEGGQQNEQEKLTVEDLSKK